MGTEYTHYNDSWVVFLSPAVPEEPEAYNLTVLIQMDGHRVLLRTEAGAFEYVADPTFKNFTGGVKKQVNKLIHAQVRAAAARGPGPGRVLRGRPLGVWVELASLTPPPHPPPGHQPEQGDDAARGRGVRGRRALHHEDADRDGPVLRAAGGAAPAQAAAEAGHDTQPARVHCACGRGRGWGAGHSSPPCLWALRPPLTQVKFGSREWVLGRVEYDSRVSEVPLSLILPLVMVPMVVVIALSIYCYW